MPESSPEERWLDDQLAEFTDRLLGEEPGIQPSAADPELRALQEMVIRLKQQLTDSQIDQRVVRQLRARIAAEWQRQNRRLPKHVEHRHTLLEQVKERLAFVRRRFRPIWGVGLVMIIAILLLVVFMPQTTSSPSTWLGTALEGSAVWPLAFLAGLLILVGVFWLWRSRR